MPPVTRTPLLRALSLSLSLLEQHEVTVPYEDWLKTQSMPGLVVIQSNGQLSPLRAFPPRIFMSGAKKVCVVIAPAVNGVASWCIHIYIC